MSTVLPVLRLTVVHHVGELREEMKRTGSHEGHGLSVSLHPGAWRRIARGHVSGPCWTMTNPSGSFLDAHRMKRSQRREVLAWGSEEGLAVSMPLWRISYWDDELEGFCRQVFDDREEALEEARAYGVRARRIIGHASTPALDRLAMQTRPSMGDELVLDMLLPLWSHRIHALDGVWWEDRLDVLALSAPRGVIVPEMLAAWDRKRLDHDPADEDKGCDEDA